VKPQKQKTPEVLSSNPVFVKKNVFNFTVDDPMTESIEVHAKGHGNMLGLSKARLAEMHLPIRKIKIGGDFFPGPDTMEQEFRFETGKESGSLVIKVIEWLPNDMLSEAGGEEKLVRSVSQLQTKDSDAAAEMDDTVSLSSQVSIGLGFRWHWL
jgi:hypothetical protein